MSYIRITSTPPGQEPEWIRELWLEVEIPLPPEPSDVIQCDISVGDAENLGGYRVKTSEAVEALRKKSHTAAAWLDKHFGPDIPSHLVFRRDCCVLIKE